MERDAATAGVDVADQTWAVPYLPIDPKDVGRTYEAVIRVNCSPARAAWPTSCAPSTTSTCRAGCRSSSARSCRRAPTSDGGEVSPAQMWEAFEAEYLAPRTPLALNSHHTVVGRRQRRRARRQRLPRRREEDAARHRQRPDRGLRRRARHRRARGPGPRLRRARPVGGWRRPGRGLRGVRDRRADRSGAWASTPTSSPRPSRPSSRPSTAPPSGSTALSIASRCHWSFVSRL